MTLDASLQQNTLAEANPPSPDLVGADELVVACRDGERG